MNLFFEDDYRKVFKKRIQQLKKTSNESYSMKGLAEFCGIQSTYLSKVLNGRGHFNEDQFYLSSVFLKFSGEEKSYLILLHSYHRSEVKARKAEIKKQIEVIRAGKSLSANELESEKLDKENPNFSEYYLDPLMQITHMFLTVEGYANNLEKISKELQVDQSAIKRVVDKLVELKIVQKEKDRIEVLKKDLFLSSDSYLVQPSHTVLKANTHHRLNSLTSNQKYSISAIYSCNASTQQKIRSLMVEMLKKVEKLAVEDAKADQIYQVSIDCFPWSNPQGLPAEEENLG